MQVSLTAQVKQFLPQGANAWKKRENIMSPHRMAAALHGDVVRLGDGTTWVRLSQWRWRCVWGRTAPGVCGPECEVRIMRLSASTHGASARSAVDVISAYLRLMLSDVLRSLRYRNFRLFTIGQSISLIGTWMQQVAVSWLVYRLTDSALLLGLVAFAAQGPTFFLAPLAGAIADRANRQRLLVLIQSLMMVQALALAVLVLTGTVAIWHIVVLSAALGCLSGFDIPVRQSLLVELVEGREDLSNAIALNSSMFNGARLIGPVLAGIAINLVGEGICILLNG